MEVIELIQEMRDICEKLRCAGKRIRLVPTMGALHTGHASLIEGAKKGQHHCARPDGRGSEFSTVKKKNDEEQEKSTTTTTTGSNISGRSNLVENEEVCHLVEGLNDDNQQAPSHTNSKTTLNSRLDFVLSSGAEANGGLLGEASTTSTTTNENSHQITTRTPTTTSITATHNGDETCRRPGDELAASSLASEKVTSWPAGALDSNKHKIKEEEDGAKSVARHTTSSKHSNYQSDNVVVVSIFVNPKQFNNPSDFVNYPNTLKADLELCRRFGVDYVFVPKSTEMYPYDDKKLNAHSKLNSTKSSTPTHSSSTIQVYPPRRFTHDLEGRSRPGHFEGMLTVVCKLFNIIRPHDAYFGEKDYQQLILVDKMVKELNMDTQIVPVETVRDPDLLPLSSRNVRLTQEQRHVAPIIYKILTDAREAIETEFMFSYENTHGDINNLLLSSMIATICLNLDDEEKSKMIDVDYLELRCSKDVSPIHYNQDLHAFDCGEHCVRRELISRKGKKLLKARLLIALIVGEIRLLDNIEVRMNLVD